MKKQINLQSMFRQLQEITDQLESGDLSLEDSVSKYSEGIKVSKKIKTKLSQLENKIQEINEGSE